MKLNLANRITILRILLIIPFVSCMLKINDPALSITMRQAMRYISVVIFFAMAASDLIDGVLARRKGQVTRLGSFLDPMADKLLMTCACLLLSSERASVEGFLLPPTVVVLIIGKDMFLSQECQDYLKFSHRGSVTPFVFDFLAFWLLNKSNKLSSDTVILNGQSGDFITGNHIPELFNKEQVTKEDLLGAIIKKHYSLWTNLHTEDNLRVIKAKIEKKILSFDEKDIYEIPVIQSLILYRIFSLYLFPSSS